MRTWRFHAFGSLDNLMLEEGPCPRPGPGEALVKLDYAALNPADALVVRGLYPRCGVPPFTVGRDGCGVVEQPVSGGRFGKGERVVVLRCEVGVTRAGTFAEYVAVPEVSLAPLPAGWSPEEGAAGPLAFLTAWRALHDVVRAKPKQTVFINGASGGVGTAAVMLANAGGLRVVAASRSEEKRRRLLELGAHIVVDSSSPDEMEEAVKEALRGGRVDAVIENLGGSYLQSSVNVVGERGRIAVIGLLAGASCELVLGKLIFKRARIEGVSVGAYTPPQTQRAWQQVVDQLDRMRQRPIVDRIMPMAQLREAFDYLARGPMGKVLVDVRI